jgi:hypothetical protein
VVVLWQCSANRGDAKKSDAEDKEASVVPVALGRGQRKSITTTRYQASLSEEHWDIFRRFFRKIR